MSLDPKQMREKRAEAQKIDVTLHVGKAGVEAAVAELDAQLKQRKLVKVRLLPAATQGADATDKEQAIRLAKATSSHLVDVRGHTAVYWRP